MSPYLSEGAENHGEHAVFLYYVAYLDRLDRVKLEAGKNAQMMAL